MADTRISGLTALAAAGLATGDLATVVDISDATMAASGTNKKITLGDLGLFGTATLVPYYDTTGNLVSEAAFAYNATTDTLTVGKLKAGVGSAAAPAYYFGTDSDSGFYSISGGTVSYSSDGTTLWLGSAATGITPARSFRLASTIGIGFAGGDPDAVADEMILYRDATRSVKLGQGGAAGGVDPIFWNAGAIGAGESPPASAKLSAASTTQGFLPPRMTTVQRDAISTPAAGLMVYNTTTAKLNVFTTAWEAVTSA